MLQSEPHQVDLTHQLVVEAETEIHVAQLGERGELRLTGSAHDRIQLANRSIHRLDAGRVGNVYLDARALATYGDDLITRGKRGNYRSADRATRPNDKNPHRPYSHLKAQYQTISLLLAVGETCPLLGCPRKPREGPKLVRLSLSVRAPIASQTGFPRFPIANAGWAPTRSVAHCSNDLSGSASASASCGYSSSIVWPFNPPLALPAGVVVAQQGPTFAVGGATITLNFGCYGNCAAAPVGASVPGGITGLAPDPTPDVKDADTTAFLKGYITIVLITPDYSAQPVIKFNSVFKALHPYQRFASSASEGFALALWRTRRFGGSVSVETIYHGPQVANDRRVRDALRSIVSGARPAADGWPRAVLHLSISARTCMRRPPGPVRLTRIGSAPRWSPLRPRGSEVPRWRQVDCAPDDPGCVGLLWGCVWRRLPAGAYQRAAGRARVGERIAELLETPVMLVVTVLAA